jgi:DNA-binding transcriptional MerR regulator
MAFLPLKQCRFVSHLEIRYLHFLRQDDCSFLEQGCPEGIQSWGPLRGSCLPSGIFSMVMFKNHGNFLKQNYKAPNTYMNAFTIKDLENLSGIKAHTIRIWEQRYQFLKPCRTSTNIRSYSNQELKMILNVSLLLKFGYKISRINQMDGQQLRDRIISLSQLEAQQEKIINSLINNMIDLDMEQFEEILDNFIRIRGIERTITQIIFPFLDRIGVLWLTNHIHPTQEHLVSNIIRQKLLVGIENVRTRLLVNKTILLFLPEGEYHELGLLYMFYLLKSRGIKILYMGSNTPVADLEFVCKHKKPDQLFTHLTCITEGFSLDKFLSDVQRLAPGIPFTVSGRLASLHHTRLPHGVHLKKSLPEVLEYISCL